jgi:hypothetical protein
MAERFAGRIHVLQSKVRILLQDMPTNISLHKHTYDSFVILFYLSMVYDLFLWFIYLFIYLFIPPNLQTFPTVVVHYLLRH